VREDGTVNERSLPPRPVVGVLHPGKMGAAVGSALKPAASAVIWAAAGRSVRTSKRAEISDLVGVPDTDELVRRADVVIALCPPDAARDLAEAVAAAAAGRAQPPLYVEANTVPVQTVREIAALLGPENVVDAVLTGPPTYEEGRTEILLSGAGAEAVAALFAGSPFAPRVVGAAPGDATSARNSEVTSPG
jgi:3-hydroxyisobutyrate dehydrogenase-like beta-hydroxyacid dehydrogenase